MAIDYTKINNIAKKYNIPEWIWKPILMTESGGNPNSIASTNSEYSIGLFQINNKVHTQYSKADLLDPYKNANIAFRDFIQPAMVYLQGLGVNNPVDLAQGVYTGINPLTNSFYSADYGGIRPNYTADVKQSYLGYLKESFLGDLKYASNVGNWFDGILSEDFYKGLDIIKDSGVDGIVDTVKTAVEYKILKSVIQFTLFIMFFVLLVKLFPETTDKILDTSTKIATKGMV